jgi:hypothetical protein
MEDVTLTQLFARMDAHLTQQDVSLQAILATLREQNVVLVETARMLAETRREMEASGREARAFWAAEREAWAALLRELRRPEGGA